MKSNDSLFVAQLEERIIELEGTRARVRVLERLQQRAPTEDPDESVETARCDHGGLEPGSSTESARDHHQAVEVKPSPRHRPSRIPLPGANKSIAPKPPALTDKAKDGRESLKSLSRPPRDSSREGSNANGTSGKFSTKTRDSSLSNKSLNKSLLVNKDTSRESLNKSLPRNNSCRDSLNKSSSLSRSRDSLESSNNCPVATLSPITPPRRPPAPARRSHSLARSVDSEAAKVRAQKPFFFTWLRSSLSNGPV